MYWIILILICWSDEKNWFLLRRLCSFFIAIYSFQFVVWHCIVYHDTASLLAKCIHWRYNSEIACHFNGWWIYLINWETFSVYIFSPCIYVACFFGVSKLQQGQQLLQIPDIRIGYSFSIRKYAHSIRKWNICTVSTSLFRPHLTFYRN